MAHELLVDFVLFICVGKNNLSKDDQRTLLALLRQMAYADTKNLYQEKLDGLLESAVYKNHSNVQRYLQRKWLICTTVCDNNACGLH